MKITQVRNATLTIEYAGTTFLIDPYLADKESTPGYEGTVNSHRRNPLVDLKTPIDRLIAVDAVIVTHTHPDHWDEAAIAIVPKALPLFAQHEKDADLIRSQGFTDVRVMTKDTLFNGVSLAKTPGLHGSREAVDAAHDILGDVCGVVFRHQDEKTLYLAGDTVWNEDVRNNLAAYDPDVVIVNAGDAQAPGLGSLIMNKEDVRTLWQAAPKATLIASHMEAVNHSLLSRKELKEYAGDHGMTDRLIVPDDNQTMTF